MALTKQTLNLPFGQGVETKVDPWQLPPGKMQALRNSVFTKGAQLQKRNGYQPLTALSDTTSKTLTTFDENLLAAGTSLQVYSQQSNQWLNKGQIQPLSLDVIPVVRSSTSQTTVDIAVASNGLACSVYLDSSTNCYYQIVDSTTGQIIVAITQLPATAAMPRVFALGYYFVITFLATVTGNSHVRYISIPVSNPTNPASATSLASTASSLSAGYDGFVANNSLYVAWNGSDGGGAIRVTSLSSILAQGSTIVIASFTSNLMSVTADMVGSTPVIWVTFWNSGNQHAYATALNQALTSILASTKVLNNIAVISLTSTARSGTYTLFYQTSNAYSYSATRSDFLSSVTCTQAGVVGTPGVILRSVGLGSKAIYDTDTSKSYMLASYGGAYQPTYFFIDQSGNILGKLAYSNGGGYAINQILPQLSLDDGVFQVGYLFKDLLLPVNKSQGVTAVSGIYSQTGINLAIFTLAEARVQAEIGNNLHLTGGFLWMYDGVKPVEHQFHVWPEDIVTVTATTTGSMTAQIYYYYATYEWTDAQGNVHRSAPSNPVKADLSGSGTATNKVTVNIPYLRLTYKTTPNSVRLVIYRWSTAQPIPYMITSVTSPQLNSPSSDSLAYVDTVADSSILGNLILYTFGGVIENIAAPACSTAVLYKSRLVLVPSEDKNTAWYSKQVVQGTPVEMSDLLTLYVSPTIGTQGSTGVTKTLGAMDDKLVFFKKNAIYYNTGQGPDNTGANNDFGDPVFVTSTVGCENQQSVVFTPQGLMFQASGGMGIWILKRDLSTDYIGAPVEEQNGATVVSALNIPGTTQVRFSLDNNVTLMYDYYYSQWGTFSNIPAISGTLYQGLHTYLRSNGQIYQENPGSYLDGSTPVLVSFTMAWSHLAGLQGYQRAYFFYLLGHYYSPHKLNVQIAYDYDSNPTQSCLITPTNYSPTYGTDPIYGSGEVYGGSSPVEQWRVFFQTQKCQAFQISVNEIYDSSLRVSPGAGLTLSSINLVVGAKSGYPRLNNNAANSIG